MNASKQIDKKITELVGWRGEMVARIRRLIHEADPEINEEWKWSTPTFAHSGQVCTVGIFKDHVKINFFKGASIKDLNGLFNAGFHAKKSRAVNLYQGDEISESTLKELIRSTVALNVG